MDFEISALFCLILVDQDTREYIANGYLSNFIFENFLITVINARTSFPFIARQGLSSTDILCFSCGLRCFKELVYQYRKEIPNEDLPNEVANRGDCYWGKNCRTQHHNPMHARLAIVFV